ncbi:MAG: YlxM family DNA-binding protein [Lachnospiraceae bacterium]|nr:YlxM family DNA-binding protein [Lachnospiraceae bacterium]
MDKLLEKSLLYDFYGELLTEHQRIVYESFVFDDMSLAEVAEEQGITRQGVHDLVKRCDKILMDYENKLHLVEKFTNIKMTISSIKELTDLEQHADMDESLRLSNIKSLSEAILEEL